MKSRKVVLTSAFLTVGKLCVAQRLLIWTRKANIRSWFWLCAWQSCRNLSSGSRGTWAHWGCSQLRRTYWRCRWRWTGSWTETRSRWSSYLRRRDCSSNMWSTRSPARQATPRHPLYKLKSLELSRTLYSPMLLKFVLNLYGTFKICFWISSILSSSFCCVALQSVRLPALQWLWRLPWGFAPEVCLQSGAGVAT